MDRFCIEDEQKIAENIEKIRERMRAAALRAGRDPSEIELEAVTKTMPAGAVNAALRAGVKIIGENRVQELCEKLPDIRLGDAQVHLIGHLQTNKVKQALPHIAMLESLDSEHLARELNRRAGELGRVLDVLIEINIGGEASKTGISPEGALALAGKMSEFPSLRLRGLMAVPPVEQTSGQSRPFFAQMRNLFLDIMRKKSDNNSINILSMGMSGDFETAIEEGSTMVRVGTSIFGKRTGRTAI